MSDGKCEATQEVLTRVLSLMELPLRVETKDASDGGVAVALFPDGDVSGFAPGKRSPVMDALQFFVNKVVNRFPENRRYIIVDSGDYRERHDQSLVSMARREALWEARTIMSHPGSGPKPAH